MAANSISNFSSIHLIPSSGQRIAIQQQIENNKHEIAKTQKEKAEIQSEIAIAQKEKAEAQRQKDCYKIILDENLKIIDYSQKAIKACEESKEIIKEMIGIYETLIARNNLQQTSVDVSSNNSSSKAQITFASNVYEKNKVVDVSQSKQSDSNTQILAEFEKAGVKCPDETQTLIIELLHKVAVLGKTELRHGVMCKHSVLTINRILEVNKEKLKPYAQKICEILEDTAPTSKAKEALQAALLPIKNVSNNNSPSKAQITFAGNVYEKNKIARNNLQQSKTKSPIVFKDINYNPPKIDFSKFDTKPLEPQESKKSYNQITKDYNRRNHSSSIFNDWFNSLRSHSLRFFKWF